MLSLKQSMVKAANSRDEIKEEKALTTDCCGSMESFSQFWVQLNVDLLVHCELQVSSLDLLANPVGEWLANDCECHVCEEFLRQSSDFDNIWKPLRHLLMVLQESANVVDAESFISRNAYVLNLGILDSLLDATAQIS